MKTIHTIPLFVTAILLALACAHAQQPLYGPMLPPDTGFGSIGPWATQVDSIAHPTRQARSVYLFRPSGAVGKVPLLFFCHGINAENPATYRALIDFAVGKGVAVLYAPFETVVAYRSPGTAYRQLWDGFFFATRTWADLVDTARIGVVGHSYGGGAVPFIAHRARENNWGEKSLFMYSMAPWYVYNVSQKILASWPPHTALLVQTFDSDKVNDPRMARDLFENCVLPPTQKGFSILYSDSRGSNSLKADHGVPVGVALHGPGVNQLDYYGVYRKLDALMRYSFDTLESARLVALGDNDTARYMGSWPDGTPVKPMYMGQRPPMSKPQNWYTNFWNHRMNPRTKIPSVRRKSSWSEVDDEITIRNYLRLNWYHKLLARKELSDDQPQEVAGGTDPDSAGRYHNAQVQPCQVTQPAKGFGANGPYTPTETLFPHPGLGDANIHVIAPLDCSAPWPVVFFAPALWKPSTMFYRGLIDHLVSRGNLVVFTTYNYGRFFNQKVRYQVVYESFNEGVEMFIDRVDTTRIAFIGHSYGAGAVPALAREFLAERNWGTRGSCLFVAAPFFLYNITQEQLTDWPFNTQLIVQVYAGDRRMDNRIAEDLFYSIGIHPRDKSFQIVADAISDKCELDSDHDAIQSENHDETNVVDYYAIYRQIDALMGSSFNADTLGRLIALGNSSPQQLDFGLWPDSTRVKPFITFTGNPRTTIPSRSFMFGWRNLANKRKAFYKALD